MRKVDKRIKEMRVGDKVQLTRAGVYNWGPYGFTFKDVYGVVASELHREVPYIVDLNLHLKKGGKRVSLSTTQMQSWVFSSSGIRRVAAVKYPLKG